MPAQPVVLGSSRETSQMATAGRHAPGFGEQGHKKKPFICPLPYGTTHPFRSSSPPPACHQPLCLAPFPLRASPQESPPPNYTTLLFTVYSMGKRLPASYRWLLQVCQGAVHLLKTAVALLSGGMGKTVGPPYLRGSGSRLCLLKPPLQMTWHLHAICTHPLWITVVPNPWQHTEHYLGMVAHILIGINLSWEYFQPIAV